MTRRYLLMTVAAVILGGAAARAEPVPTTTSAPGGAYQGFTYRTEVVPGGPVPDALPASAGGAVVVPAGVTSGGGTLGATFTPVGDYLPGVLNTPVGAGKLVLGGAASSESRATMFDASFGGAGASGAYSYGVWVRDTEAKATTLFAFNGLLSGGVKMNADGTMTDTITNTLTGPSSITQTIGAHRYTVELLPLPEPRLSSFTLDGVEKVVGESAPLEYRARISIDGVVQTPEPATAVMALLGLGAVGAARRRKAKGAARAA